MVQHKIGTFRSRKNMEDELNRWIVQYVTSDPNADDVTKAEKPLAEGRVEVDDVPGNPGYYTSKFFLRPHFQLEGLTVSLRLVSRMPPLRTS
jgi:type VI secretion system protein ImpC